MNKKITFSVLIAAVSLVSACAGTQKRQDSTLVQPLQPVAYQAVINREPEAAASLWNDVSANNLFQDLRAHRVGDLVTVNIVETSKASKAANTQTGRSSSMDVGIENLMGWEGRLKNLTSFGKSDVRDGYDNTSILKGSMQNDFNGSGSTSRNDSMTASITARVMEVRPNGNLFIKGTREIRVNNETQIIILSGQIRPADISPDNTVLSSYIGDARIEYIGTGALSDKQKPGWLMKTVDYVWPF